MKGKVSFYPKSLNLMSFEERKDHKDRLLRESIRYMYNNSPNYYQLRFKECGAEPEDIKTVEDLRKLPIMMDKDKERESMEASLERDGHPFGLHICCDPSDVVITGGTSGTTGHPTYPYTQSKEDMEIVSSQIAYMHNDVMGLGKGDRAFFLFPLGVYATSIILSGMEKASILPLAIDIRLGTQPAMDLIQWTRPTLWWTGPAIAEYYIDVFKKKGIDPRDLKFKALALTGEMGVDIPELKKKLEEAYGCRWYDFWVPSLVGFCISCDSDEFHGLHKFGDDWDICYEDLIDPETKEPIEITDGAIGEVVATHLQKKASPYLRYATGDIVEVYTSECPGCGFNGYRIKVRGRSDDMLTVKGVNVFGGAIKSIVQKFVPRVTGHMRIIKEDPSPRISQIKLRVEYSSGMGNNLGELETEIKEIMKQDLRINPKIEWTPEESLGRPIRKPPLFEKRY